jgi:pyruvate/2-oxoglutarate dehydrogenase complex dihydrolipoamide acyltransferase (E2) component
MTQQATKVILPKSGMGIEEGTVARWTKSVGDRVQQGEVLAEVETAKALQEVEAPVSGTLVEITVPVGGVAAVYATLALIADEHG